MMKTEECINRFTLAFQFKYSKSTLNNYRRAVRQMHEFTGKAFDAITKRDIQNWLQHLVEKEERVATIYLKVNGLKSFFNYCYEEELILQDPAKALPLPHRKDSLPRYLSYEQLNQLRVLLKGNSKYRALIEVLYATGVRISELVAMEKSDIHWSERYIVIANGKGKKGRIVCFTQECVEHLKAYLNSRSDELPYVFVNKKGTKPLCIGTNTEMFISISKKLGFRVTPHMMRHTFAAHLSQKGMPLESIRILLGHEDIRNTQIYTRLYDHARKEIYDDFM